MKSSYKFLLHLFVGLCLASCASQRHQVWLPDERSGLGRINPDDFRRGIGIASTRNILERTISRPVNRNDSSAMFDLYYFVRMPPVRATRTVLYIPGGPGQFIPGPILLPTIADFLIDNGYNVVFYHARGSGFSQIRPSNTYDRFLRTSYVLDDIEAIRKDLIRQGFLSTKGSWDAVIGYSFGTNVAQQYAGTYPNNVDRLILIGVQSRHGFESMPVPFDEINNSIRDINRYTLEKIYQRADFNDLTPERKSYIIDTAFGTTNAKGIYQRAEDKFGSIGYVVSAYCELKAQNELARYDLDYSQQFFRALQRLRDVGWFPTSNTQLVFGMQIKDGILGTAPSASDCGPDLTGSSDRVRYVVSIYDGINMRFLKKWLESGKRNLSDAVKESGGDAHYERNINRYVDKIGITESETIEPLDPARYKHNKPTLILKGSADTVPVGGAAEYIFLDALAGPRTLIEYPGVGHFYILPKIPLAAQSTPEANPAVCTPGAWILDCLIYSFLEMSPKDFSNPDVNRILAVIIRDDAKICYRDQGMPQTLQVAGTCE
jgi:pimeloyl-ACP methyl ester carboxylesterase